MKKNVIINFLKGMCIGGTMTVPGISGGSMAMILGIYDKMIASVNKLLKFDKKSIFFLIQCVLGALLGMVLFSSSILVLIERFPMAMKYFFIGAVVGGAPMIYRSARVDKFTPSSVLFPVLGIIIVYLISLIPEGVFAPTDHLTLSSFLIQIIGGVIIAIALVLPGISVSQMLLMLGLYEIVMGAVATLNVLPIIPLVLGILLGTLSTAHIMDKAMTKAPKATYLIILGFILGSVRELFPGFPEGFDIIISLISAILGFFVVYTISTKTKDM